MAEFYKKPKEKEFKITEEEYTKLKEAFKNQEFKELFIEYLNEISDPENKRKYEEEIIALEKEQGYTATFIHPEPYYVLKCLSNENQKIFINICSNSNVAVPTKTDTNSNIGSNWSIPYFLSPPHKDWDKKYQECQVVDAIFHPEAIHMAKQSKEFNKLVSDIAVDGIEEKFKIKIKRNLIKTPKLKYKGVQRPLIIKSKDENYNPKESTEPKASATEEKCVSMTPQYQIKYVEHVDMQDYATNITRSTRPKEIAIEITLPLIVNLDAIFLEIFEKRLYLEAAKGLYKLDLCLSYKVDEEKGSAHFDKERRILFVKLPVIQEHCPLKYFEEPEQSEEDVSIDTDPPPTILDAVNEEISKVTCCCQVSNEHRPLHCPPFSVAQTEGILVLIFNVTSIVQDSVSLRTCSNHRCHSITFSSIGNGCFPLYYYFQFESDPSCSLTACGVCDLTQNLVVRWDKVVPERWTHIFAGLAKDSYTKHLLPCKENLLSMWDVLNQEKVGEMFSTEQIQLKIVSSTELHFAVDLQPPAKLDTVPEERSVPTRTSSESSEDAVPPARPHGILKYPRTWRSISESSDDMGIQEGPHSKKTVRFNDHVSRAVFKANSSILGQRKKNQRKAKSRRNRTSSQSEESTGTESDCNSNMESGEPNATIPTEVAPVPVQHPPKEKAALAEIKNEEIFKAPEAPPPERRKKNKKKKRMFNNNHLQGFLNQSEDLNSDQTSQDESSPSAVDSAPFDLPTPSVSSGPANSLINHCEEDKNSTLEDTKTSDINDHLEQPQNNKTSSNSAHPPDEDAASTSKDFRTSVDSIIGDLTKETPEDIQPTVKRTSIPENGSDEAFKEQQACRESAQRGIKFDNTVLYELD